MKTSAFLIVAFIALFPSTNTVNAQTSHTEPVYDAVNTPDPSKETYEKETIYLNGSMSEYTKNKTDHRVGFFARKLKKEFANCSEETQNEMGACVKKKKRGALLLSAGGVLLIGALVVAPLVTGPIVAGLAISGLVPYTLGTVDLQQSQDHLQKSVWLYNRDVITK